MLIGHQLTKDGFWSSLGMVDPKLPADWPATINPWRISRTLIESFIGYDSFLEMKKKNVERFSKCVLILIYWNLLCSIPPAIVPVAHPC